MLQSIGTETIKREAAYIHFSMRKMELQFSYKRGDSYYITKNGFIKKSQEKEPDINEIEKMNPYPNFIQNIWGRFMFYYRFTVKRRLKRKIKLLFE